MLPKVVVYNSVSVDGAVRDFDVNVALHYEMIDKVGLDALLVGSATAKMGIELFVPTVPDERPDDFQKPSNPDKDAPWWVIPDSHGILQGLLHVHRNSGYAKDIIVLVSSNTPKGYLEYLKKRNYNYIIAGSDHIDYKAALEELNRCHGIKTVATDTGGILASVLLDTGLVDELQLLVAPEIVGEKAVTLFRNLKQNVKLELIECKTVQNSHVLLTYRVKKKA
jgi:2,5-diamino-6-(ribosylamino)-4(3H)-pyrimidinone 5'-phosphate reductase